MNAFTKEQKAEIRAIVTDHYDTRDGRNVRVMANGEVHVTVDGYQTYSNSHVLFAGYAKDILSDGHC